MKPFFDVNLKITENRGGKSITIKNISAFGKKNLKFGPVCIEDTSKQWDNIDIIFTIRTT